MTAAKAKEDKKDQPKEEGKEKKPKEEEEEKDAPPPPPPLEAAAQRLERLLGGGMITKDQIFHSYTNPAKVLRRWLGTSSGAAADATADDIKSAAAKLLDPSGMCAEGRRLIVSDEQVESMMEVDSPDKDYKTAATPSYLSAASSREVESWLISLAVRLLWREKKFSEALDLAQKGISVITAHLEEASRKITSVSAASAASLFPLLARMYRLRSLVAESLDDPSVNASLRVDMTKAYNVASLRRDVDTQATLLNCLLRDLLRDSQGKRSIILPSFLRFRFHLPANDFSPTSCNL